MNVADRGMLMFMGRAAVWGYGEMMMMMVPYRIGSLRTWTAGYGGAVAPVVVVESSWG